MIEIKSAAPFRPLRGDTNGALQNAIGQLKSRLRRAARKIAVRDLDWAEDLYQLAITHLWELDPARFDSDDEGFLWTALINRMLMARRADDGNPTRPPLALRFA